MLSSARCAGCANAHEGSENVIRSRCEACLTKAPCYGLLEEGKKRWCAGCAKVRRPALHARPQPRSARPHAATVRGGSAPCSPMRGPREGPHNGVGASASLPLSESLALSYYIEDCMEGCAS